MHTSYLFLLGSIVGLAATEMAAAEACTGTNLHRVERLSDVPEDIKLLLGTELPGIAGMAEKGSEFNATDAILEPFPMRRFQGAVLSDSCALVTVEHGGIAHYFKDEHFEFQDGHWRLSKFRA